MSVAPCRALTAAHSPHRFESEAAYAAVKGCYVVTADTMSKAKPSCRIMHPLPRVGEIAEEVDEDPQVSL